MQYSNPNVMNPYQQQQGSRFNNQMNQFGNPYNPYGGGGQQNPYQGQGQNYFSPNAQNTYSSQQGLMGSGNPMMSGGYAGSPAGPLMQSGGGYQGGQGGGGLGNFNPMSFAGNAIGGIGDIINGFMGYRDSKKNYPNPADAGMKYLDQIPGTIKPYYDPYINAGRSALNTLNGQYGNLINDPGALMKQLGAGYQQSPGYQFQVQQAGDAANRAAAAGGMLGSPMEQQNVAGTVNNLANHDYYNYLDRTLGLYGQGLGGLGNINQMGYGASSNLADQLASLLQSQGTMAYAGQANQNMMDANQQARRRGGIGDIFGGIGRIFGG